MLHLIRRIEQEWSFQLVFHRHSSISFSIPFFYKIASFSSLSITVLKTLFVEFFFFFSLSQTMTSSGNRRHTNWFPMSLVMAVPAATSKAMGFGTSLGSSTDTNPKFWAYHSTVDESVNA